MPCAERATSWIPIKPLSGQAQDTNEETEAHRGQVAVPGHTASTHWSGILGLDTAYWTQTTVEWSRVGVGRGRKEAGVSVLNIPLWN